MSTTRALPRQCAPPSWVGDPTILVYAVRYALGRDSHAPVLLRQAVTANLPALPLTAREAIADAICEWLDGPGRDVPQKLHDPWVLVLAALGRRRALAVDPVEDGVR